jgi:cytochrome c-type biogenesis protein CcmH/NrfG
MAQAARAYRKLLELNPDSSDIRNNLAFALLEQGHKEVLPDARKLAEEAVAKNPGSSAYLDTLGRIHLKSGDLQAAEQVFERALAIQQDSLEAMIGLADVYVQAGHRDKAGQMLVRINNALEGNSPPSVALRLQLDEVRRSVKGPVQSGRLE